MKKKKTERNKKKSAQGKKRESGDTVTVRTPTFSSGH